MKLREISVQTIPKYKDQKSFNSSVWCIQEMYWYQLKELKTKDVAKITLILGDEKSDRKFGEILTIYRSFDFDKYFFGMGDHEKKKTILDLLHGEILRVSEDHGMDRNELVRAYNYCIDNDLENKWLLKNRHFQSPDGQYYGAIECIWGPSSFAADGVVFDSEKNEVIRRRLVERDPFLGDFIYYCTCGWDNGIFYLKSRDKEKWGIKPT